MKSSGYLLVAILSRLNLFLLVFCIPDQLGSQPYFSVRPLSVRAGSLQTIQYTFKAGPPGLAQGGGIRIEIPVAYAETEFLHWSKPQVTYREDLGFVSAETSNKAQVELKAHGLLGGVVDIVLKDRGLPAGGMIVITYKGKVQSLSGRVPMRYAIKQNERDGWHAQADIPFLRVLPVEASHVLLTYPADLVKGEEFEASLVAIDKFGNPAGHFTGKINLQSTDTLAVLPVSVQFSARDSGIQTLKKVKFNTTGFQKITGTDPLNEVKVTWHYTRVWEKVPRSKHWYGDTHFHTGTGTNNAGFFTTEGSTQNIISDTKRFQSLNLGGDHRANFTNAIDAYTYASKIMRLDFGSSSEHDSPLLTDTVWKIGQHITDSFNKPGLFTTFYSYEWTPDTNHYIILYKSGLGKVLNHFQYPGTLDLWRGLDEQGIPAMTIPHVSWVFENHNIWNEINDTYHRIGELYSLWNNRFLVQPDDLPQRFELGENNKWSYQYAWNKGHHIGVIGSTDNHLGRPGANNYTAYTQHTGGLAVALAPANNRDDLWDAFHQRRTYATTGTRIYMDFTADDHEMGSEYEAVGRPVFKAKVAGTNQLARIELVKMEDGHFTTIYQINPNAETIEFTYTDNAYIRSSMYYLRVTQVKEYPNQLYGHTTAEMAWSSPIWINRK